MNAFDNNNNEDKITVYLGCDSFGQNLLTIIKEHLLQTKGITVHDLGCDTYYDSAAKVAKKVAYQNPKHAIGVLFCGTGMGVGIIANKFGGVRAATCENVNAAKCARAVNNANILCLGQLVTKPHLAIHILNAFIKQDFIQCPCCGEGQDGGQPVTWWSSDVESFLGTSMDGIAKIEQEAALEYRKKNLK